MPILLHLRLTVTNEVRNVSCHTCSATHYLRLYFNCILKSNAQVFFDHLLYARKVCLTVVKSKKTKSTLISCSAFSFYYSQWTWGWNCSKWKPICYQLWNVRMIANHKHNWSAWPIFHSPFFFALHAFYFHSISFQIRSWFFWNAFWMRGNGIWVFVCLLMYFRRLLPEM